MESAKNMPTSIYIEKSDIATFEKYSSNDLDDLVYSQLEDNREFIKPDLLLLENDIAELYIHYISFK